MRPLCDGGRPPTKPGAVVDCRSMDAVKLRFPGRDTADRPLAVGVHAIARIGDDEVEVVEGADADIRLCVDRRGVWLAVEGGAGGVHVNGRSIRRLAMLRVGDTIYVEGIEMRLVGEAPPQVPPPGLQGYGLEAPDPRVVLRGVGGRYHGRSFTLERPRLVGRNATADIRIDDPAFADRHARLELVGDQVVMRDLGSAEGSVVNGEAMRDAVLAAGDQVVFDAHHRFVVEAPRRSLPAMPDVAPDDAVDTFDAGDGEDRGPAWRLPWLLLAALLLAMLLSALLLFGPG